MSWLNGQTNNRKIESRTSERSLCKIKHEENEMRNALHSIGLGRERPAELPYIHSIVHIQTHRNDVLVVLLSLHSLLNP